MQARAHRCSTMPPTSTHGTERSGEWHPWTTGFATAVCLFCLDCSIVSRSVPWWNEVKCSPAIGLPCSPFSGGKSPTRVEFSTTSPLKRPHSSGEKDFARWNISVACNEIPRATRRRNVSASPVSRSIHSSTGTSRVIEGFQVFATRRSDPRHSCSENGTRSRSSTGTARFSRIGPSQTKYRPHKGPCGSQESENGLGTSA